MSLPGKMHLHFAAHTVQATSNLVVQCSSRCGVLVSPLPPFPLPFPPFFPHFPLLFLPFLFPPLTCQEKCICDLLPLSSRWWVYDMQAGSASISLLGYKDHDHTFGVVTDFVPVPPPPLLFLYLYSIIIFFIPVF